MSTKYYRVYDCIPISTVEKVGFPTNFNYLNLNQAEFFEEVVDLVIGLYKEQYVDLVSTLKEELETMALQAKEVLDEYS